MSQNVADISPGILAIFNNVAIGRETEFEEWFQHEHLAKRIALPGFLFGRRYEAVLGQPRYFNFYLAQSAAIFKSTAWTPSHGRAAAALHWVLKRGGLS